MDIDPALAPVVQRILHELKASGNAKVEGFWSREKALKWGEDLSQECKVRAEGRTAETIKAGRTCDRRGSYPSASRRHPMEQD